MSMFARFGSHLINRHAIRSVHIEEVATPQVKSLFNGLPSVVSHKVVVTWRTKDFSGGTFWQSTDDKMEFSYGTRGEAERAVASIVEGK